MNKYVISKSLGELVPNCDNIYCDDNITIDAKSDGTGVVINGPAAVSKEYVDTELAKKAPLVSTASSTYVTDINGNTTSIPYTPDTFPNYL